MKLKAILTGIVVLVIFTVSKTNAQHISLGPVAGFGHSFLSIEDNDNDKDFFPAYNGGLKLIYSIDPHWGVSGAVKFSGEGGKSSFTTAGNEYKTQYRANYIRVPFEGIYFFGDLGEKVRPKIAIGPSFGFLVGGKTKSKANGVTTNTLETKDLLEGFDFGLTGAAGANFNLGGDTWLNADIAYYHGLTDAAQTGSSKIKNRNLGLNLGLLFPIGK